MIDEHAAPLPNPPPEGEGIRQKCYRLPRSSRLRGDGTFKKILDAGQRKWQGPIGMSIAPADAPACRVGISIGRPVGSAPVRNAIKRKLREAFRLMQHDWPAKYDVVLLVRRHEPFTLAEYQRLLTGLMVRCLKNRDKPA